MIIPQIIGGITNIIVTTHVRVVVLFLFSQSFTRRVVKRQANEAEEIIANMGVINGYTNISRINIALSP